MTTIYSGDGRLQEQFVLNPDGLTYSKIVRTLPISAAGADVPAGTSADPTHITGGGFDVPVSPSTTSGAYSPGDVIGGFIEFTVAENNDAPVLVTGVQVTFKAAVQPNLRLIFMGGTPASALADNAAYSQSATDSLLVRRSLSSLLLGASYTTHGTPKTISLAPPPFVMMPFTGTKKIGVYVVDDTGVTLTSTADMQVRVSGLGA